MKSTVTREKAKKIAAESIICDLALGFEPEIEYPYKWETLENYYRAGITCISLHVATDLTSTERTMLYLASFLERLKSEQDKYLLIKDSKDIVTAKKTKKLGICLVFQGTNPIAKSIGMIDLYYALGIRSMILSYNIRNAIGDGCIEANDAGLSAFGANVVRRMNEIGMVIDCSHTGYKTSMDAMKLSTAPVIFSHSNAYSIYQHPRNLKDEQIKACAEIRGVIGINGVNALLGNKNASIVKFIEHIDYIAELVGPEYISLGIDEIYFPEIMNSYLRNNSILFNQSYTQGFPVTTDPKKMWKSIKPHQIIEIVDLLLQRGYTEANIKGILGTNYLRVFESVCGFGFH